MTEFNICKIFFLLLQDPSDAVALVSHLSMVATLSSPTPCRILVIAKYTNYSILQRNLNFFCQICHVSIKLVNQRWTQEHFPQQHHIGGCKARGFYFFNCFFLQWIVSQDAVLLYTDIYVVCSLFIHSFPSIGFNTGVRSVVLLFCSTQCVVRSTLSLIGFKDVCAGEELHKLVLYKCSLYYVYYPMQFTDMLNSNQLIRQRTVLGVDIFFVTLFSELQLTDLSQTGAKALILECC